MGDGGAAARTLTLHLQGFRKHSSSRPVPLPWAAALSPDLIQLQASFQGAYGFDAAIVHGSYRSTPQWLVGCLA